MEIPSQQPTDHVLTAARATSLLRRHFSLRGQDSESAQGKQRHVLTFPRRCPFCHVQRRTFEFPRIHRYNVENYILRCMKLIGFPSKINPC